MTREYTTEEIKYMFIKDIINAINHWAEIQPITEKLTTRDRLYRLAFSILVVLDGEDMSWPAFILAPNPCKEDKQFKIDHKKNYFPNCNLKIKGDIAGDLHNKLNALFKKHDNNSQNTDQINK